MVTSSSSVRRLAGPAGEIIADERKSVARACTPPDQPAVREPLGLAWCGSSRAGTSWRPGTIGSARRIGASGVHMRDQEMGLNRGRPTRAVDRSNEPSRCESRRGTLRYRLSQRAAAAPEPLLRQQRACSGELDVGLRRCAGLLRRASRVVFCRGHFGSEMRWKGTHRGGSPFLMRGVTVTGVRDDRIALPACTWSQSSRAE
jgi:hypothetical protein